MAAPLSWLNRFDEVETLVQAWPHPYVDTGIVQNWLQVGRRQAQKILAPCVTHQIGSNGVATKQDFLQRLQELANGKEGTWQQNRQQRVSQLINRLRQDRLQNPQVPIEAPVSIVNQEISDLPSGVLLQPGQIVIQFHAPQEALEKLLALAMAIGNNIEKFELLTRVEKT